MDVGAFGDVESEDCLLGLGDTRVRVIDDDGAEEVPCRLRDAPADTERREAVEDLRKKVKSNIGQGRFAEACSVLQDLYCRTADPECIFECGLVLGEAGVFGAAAKVFLQYLTLKPMSWGAACYLSIALEEGGFWREAMPSYLFLGSGMLNPAKHRENLLPTVAFTMDDIARFKAFIDELPDE